jgi:hypothetical protein
MLSGRKADKKVNKNAGKWGKNAEGGAPGKSVQTMEPALLAGARPPRI